MAESKKVKVAAVYYFGEGHEMKADKGLSIRLWGILFECDGEAYKAELDADSAKAIIDAGRAVKA